MNKTKVKTTIKIPSSVDAERWINDDTFLYKGKLYKLMPNFKVVQPVVK